MTGSIFEAECEVFFFFDGGSAFAVVAVRLAKRAKDKMVRIIFSFSDCNFAPGGYLGRKSRGSDRQNPRRQFAIRVKKAIATRIVFFSLSHPRGGLRKMFVGQHYPDAHNHAHQKTNHETKSGGVTHRALR